MTSVSAVKFPKGSIRAYWKLSPTSRSVPQKQDALDLAKGQGGNTAAGAVPPAEGNVGQSAERAVRWGWTWAGLGWAGRRWQKREGRRYLNHGVTGTVAPGERQG